MDKLNERILMLMLMDLVESELLSDDEAERVRRAYMSKSVISNDGSDDGEAA